MACGAATLAMPANTIAAAPRAAHGTVTIRRDAYGVPHVFADTTYGLFYGFGHALAEDQLYQIEILKRTAEGRIAEVLGGRYLSGDEQARSSVDRVSLAAQYRALGRADKDIFRGMADGINAEVRKALASPDALPRDFADAGFRPEPWGPLDVVQLYEHSMAIRFSDLNAELDSLALLTRLRATHGNAPAWRLFEQLRWAGDDAAPTTIAAIDQHDLPVPTGTPRRAAAQLDALPNGLLGLPDTVLYGRGASAVAARGPDDAPHASNAWLAAPTRTTSGETVLVNGPQMGDYASAYVWSIGLHGAGFNVVGSAPVGSPWLLFGTNGAIGWGSTAGLGDTVDIYQERLDPRDRRRYMFRGASLPMTRRSETIGVRDAAPVRIDVWATVHGTVELFDAADGVAYARKRSWAGSELASLVAWVHAMRATDYAAWRAEVSKVSIAINNYYADARGNIAYQFLGRFPIRPAGQDFRLPVTGDGSMEWSGLHPGTDNPYVLNPRGGIIVNWNNKPQPRYNNGDFMYWSKADRVVELDEQLDRTPRLSPGALWDVIRATAFTDVTARYFLDLVRTQAPHWPAASKPARAAAILAGWNRRTADPFTARAEPGYLLHRAFVAELLERLYAPLAPADGAGKAAFERDFLKFDPIIPSMGVKIAYAALSSSARDGVLDGRRPADLIGGALEAALDEISGRLGSDPAQWAEPAAPHPFPRENYAGVPMTTDPAAITLPVHMNRGTENDRIVFVNGRTTFCDVTPPGESGRWSYGGSPHHLDQLPLYRSFGCKPEWLYPADVIRHAVSVERLRY